MINESGRPDERYKDLSTLYDQLFPLDADGAATVSFLADHAAGGRILELGVGTGRVALPLAELGGEVTGVDASPDMLAVLRSKDRDGRINTVQADMAEPGLTGPFDLVYTVWNSLLELPDQSRQVDCVTSAAALLRDGGRFVVETVVANRVFADQRPITIGPSDKTDSATFQLIRYDHLDQVVDYSHVLLGPTGVKVMSSRHRMIYLPELDLMARIAGLELEARHADWSGAQFTASSGRHISVYRKS